MGIFGRNLQKTYSLSGKRRDQAKTLAWIDEWVEGPFNEMRTRAGLEG